jgi:NADPH:quinone reductase-like Zn-dependent oxidoreductase
MVFDLIGGATRERSWKLLKKGGVLVSTLTDPSQEKANKLGVRPCDGRSGWRRACRDREPYCRWQVKPYVYKTFPLASAAEALVEQGRSVGKVVLRVE